MMESHRYANNVVLLLQPKPCLPDVLVTHTRRLLALGRVPAPTTARATLAARLRERRTS
jgi:hypothetical protein